VESLIASLPHQEIIREEHELRLHLTLLKEVLIVAKACRADMMASACRLTAAARFQNVRQNSAGMPEF
jgi:hypothetical protein